MGDTNETPYVSGVHEFVFGCSIDARDTFEKYWDQLGFKAVQEGHIDAQSAKKLYGYEQPVTSVLLEHPGCEPAKGGYVRLQCWDTLRNDGVGMASPATCGSRWMGMYTNDILRIYDAYKDSSKKYDKDWWISNIARAAIEWPEPEFDFIKPFVGLRELVVLTEFARHAFIQRSGFDRAGFGTIAEDLPFKNSEGTHANIVQPVAEFNAQFYKDVFGWVTAPYGEAEDIGDKPATIEVLDLEPGQVIRMERLKSPHSPTGMLQVYSPYTSSVASVSDCAQPGSRGLSAYTVLIADIDGAISRAEQAGATQISGLLQDEFGRQVCTFTAPDGFAWGVIRYVA